MQSIFFDPGETTGWAIFDQNHGMGKAGYTKNIAKFLYELRKNNFWLVGIEKFSIHPEKAVAFIRSEMYTIQVIGMIKYWKYSTQLNCDLIIQPNTVKSMGYRYGNLKKLPHSNPMNHQLDAIAHGLYYLQSHGLRQPQQGRLEPQ